jgi:putative ABC transport system permease protein
MLQMRFVGNKDLGFDRNGIIQLSGLPQYLEMSKREVLENELAAIPQIETVSGTLFEPKHHAETYMMVSEIEWPGKAPDANPAFQMVFTDSRFAETLRLTMRTGEWLNKNAMQKVVLNEEAVRVMGLSDPVGAIIRIVTTTAGRMDEVEVAGVVNDFHTLSFRSRINPSIFAQAPPRGRGPVMDNILPIRVIPGPEQEAMRQITAALMNLDAAMADVSLTPISELFDRFNRSEQSGLKLFSILAVVCLLISLFGIYAVASASTQRRRKEIAIRKVVGAEVRDIVRLFFREYTLLVVIAGIVALPLAYYVMYRWLEGYAYRTNIPWWLLTTVIAGVVAVVLLSVLGQVMRAANSNPAEVIKKE